MESILKVKRNFKKFERSPRYYKKLEEKAMALTKHKFERISKDKYKYKGVRNAATITTGLKRFYGHLICDCAHMMKHGICIHLVAFSWLFEKSCYTNYSNKPRIQLIFF